MKSNLTYRTEQINIMLKVISEQEVELATLR